MPGPLEVTTLLRQSVRFQIRLRRHDSNKGFPKHEGTKMLVDLKTDMIHGAVVVLPASWPQVHGAAERLSELYTDANGYRSMAILHVATAIELGAREFLTFDDNQSILARTEGLVVPV